MPRPVLQRLGGGGRGAARRRRLERSLLEALCGVDVQRSHRGARTSDWRGELTSASLSLCCCCCYGRKGRCSCERARAPGVPRHTPRSHPYRRPHPPLAPSCTLLRPHPPLAPPPLAPSCAHTLLHLLLPQGGGEEAHLLKARWARLDCEKYVERPKPSPRPLLTTQEAEQRTQRMEAEASISSISSAGAAGAAGGGKVHCAPLVRGVLLLLVSDRPNQFLCHYFESAALHGLSPTVLGWDDSGWASGERKPWTYYLGGKLVLPLEYLERCAYPDDALVLFTDHDVVFQGGYDAMRAAYERAVAASNGAPLIFSAEKESYPRELQGLYPSAPLDPSRGPADYLNSGMWMGPVGGAKVIHKAPPLPLSLCLLRRLSSASPPPLLRLSSASPQPLLSPSPPPLPLCPSHPSPTLRPSPLRCGRSSLPLPPPPSPSLPLLLPPSRSRSCA